MGRGVLVVVLAGLFVQMVPAESVSVYFDQAAWQAAMSQNGANPLTTVSFANAQWSSTLESLPRSSTLVSQSSTAASDGMSISIDSSCGAPGVCGPFGQVSNGVWNDNLSKYSTTDFLFSSGIYGFGGDFNIAGSNGLFIGPAGDVPGGDGFIGFISDQPLTDVLISWGQIGSCFECFGNSYTLSNVQVATIPTPEPNFKYAVLGLTALAIGYGISRRGVHS